MRQFLIFLVLFFFVVSSPIIEEIKEKREQERKIYQKIIADCLLKSEASNELKKLVQDNEEDDLRKVLYNYFTSDINTNDKEIIRECSRETFRKMRVNHLNINKKFNI